MYQYGTRNFELSTTSGFRRLLGYACRYDAHQSDHVKMGSLYSCIFFLTSLRLLMSGSAQPVRFNTRPDVCLSELSSAVSSFRDGTTNSSRTQLQELVLDQLEASRSCLCTSSYQVRCKNVLLQSHVGAGPCIPVYFAHMNFVNPCRPIPKLGSPFFSMTYPPTSPSRATCRS